MDDRGGRSRDDLPHWRRHILLVLILIAAALFASLGVPQPAAAVPTVVGNASPAVMLGGQVTDTATLLEALGESTISLTFTLYGPGDLTCTGDNVTVTATAVSGPASATGAALISIAAPIPQISVIKAASPTTLPEPGGTFTYTITVTNVGVDPVPIVDLIDDVYGDLNGQGTCSTGVMLAPNGGTYSCTFPGVFTGNAGATLTDTILVGVQGPESGALERASATVSLTDVPPTVSVGHNVVPPVLPEPGGEFEHRVTVTNTSSEPVTIASLGDDCTGISLPGTAPHARPPASPCYRRAGFATARSAPASWARAVPVRRTPLAP